MTLRCLRPSAVLTAILVVSLALSQVLVPAASAQAGVPTPDQLDQLLSPIALYPDSLLAQITTASTNPQEILDVDNWLQQNQGLTGTALTDAAQAQGFDPAFVALVNFPQVLDMMAQHIDDYAAIGDAFNADQGAVSASIQRLRAQAYNAGTLRSTPQQQVEVQQDAGQTVYVIQPVNPQVVYVPTYDPTVVYVAPGPGAYASPLITFGIGIGIGALLVSSRPYYWGGWGWNWGGRRVYYNHGPWHGWGSHPYRPRRVWYRPRPVVYANRPGYGGNWHYRPRNYRPPSQPSPRPPNRPGNNRPGNNQPGNRPPNNRPGGGGTGNRPPNGNHPPNNARPATRPARPETPNNRPGMKPPAETKPSRPTPNHPPNNRPPNGRPPAARPNPPDNSSHQPSHQPNKDRPTENRRPSGPGATQQKTHERSQPQQKPPAHEEQNPDAHKK
ncbi:MAG TPA: DUF3300 domain-containing protein [Candidatus Acidoferrales bacterium]|jgi:hypothetical protein|nr:DUF3300 domain-containing protein [Candidatus Acidoferrales bacterium]